MKTALIYGFLAALMAFCFMYLDTKLLDNPKSKTTYLKNMSMVAFIVAFGIHMIGEGAFEGALGMAGGGHGDYGDDDYGHGEYKEDYGEEMLVGEPNF